MARAERSGPSSFWPSASNPLPRGREAAQLQAVSSPFRMRRLLVRLALLFAVAQFIAALTVIFGLPTLRGQPLGAALLVLLAVVDLGMLALFASWIIRGSLGGPVEHLAADIH